MSTSSQIVSMTMSKSKGHGQCANCANDETKPIPSEKPTVVGIYGVPGCGKSYMLSRLQNILAEEDFVFHEGSMKIDKLVPGGLRAFKQLDKPSQMGVRERAISEIHSECIDTGKVAVVTGHLMFWTDGQIGAEHVYTHCDLETYTHILYLDAPPNIIAQRWKDDSGKARGGVTPSHIRKWQEAEKVLLSDLCHKHSILFTVIRGFEMEPRAEALLRDFQRHSETHNLTEAQRELDEVVSSSNDKPETVLVMDADRTLAASDASDLFWQRILYSSSAESEGSPLKRLFSSSWGYSYAAFRQATLLYETFSDDEDFDLRCQNVAAQICLYPEFESLLQLVTTQKHITAVVITSGLRRVWQKVLKRANLLQKVRVLGGGRIADGFVVTPEVKEALVRRLRDVHRKYIWAFGDSRLDLGMLKQAHQAVVVVGEGQLRSKTMDNFLEKMIEDEGLSARQTLLSSTALPRLDTYRLPIVQLSDHAFTDSILRRHIGHAHMQLILAGDKPAAKILATEMRDAAIAGPNLREAHRRAGLYLAIEYLGDVVGLEEKLIEHVLGHPTSGSQLAGEHKTIIVAMMRGGEPMAYGVSDIFSKAMFLHAKHPSDVQFHHLKGQQTVLLVDSVINTGQSVIDFVQHIRKLHPTIRIAVIAGVVQARAVAAENPESLMRRLSVYTGLTLIGLRTSPTKFTGSGTTDTGNRLFNTTRLP